MTDYLDGFLGSTVRFRSRTLGPLVCEAVSLSPAIDGDLVVYFGAGSDDREPLVRIHSECVFGEVFDSNLCDCADQLKLALQRLRREKMGILFYLRLDGRGAGLAAKVKATALEVQGMDTYDSRVAIGVAPESRDFTAVARFLRTKKINNIRLLTNNPDKVSQLQRLGLAVTIEPLLVENPSEDVRRLYDTKRTKFGHKIPSRPIEPEQLKLDI